MKIEKIIFFIISLSFMAVGFLFGIILNGFRAGLTYFSDMIEIFKE